MTRLRQTARTTAAFVAWSVALAALAFAGPAHAFAAGVTAGANGVFEVQVMSGGAWRTVAAPEFGLAFTTRFVDLGGDFTQVRLVEHGGTAAQIDSALLDGAAPVLVSGSGDPLVAAKMSAADSDVTNVYGEAVVLAFPRGGALLQLTARVQGDISSTFPFQYPAANMYLPVTAGSSFYSCDIGGLPAVIDTGGEPFVRMLAEPGTGHPKGYTYVWLARSDEGLLATIDFTSDNTMDGNEDFAQVHVKTPAGVKTFKLSVGERRWGDVAFVYTDKVSYQHKLYSFSIPWSEIGADQGRVGLAFTTYGTSAPTAMPVYRFYNKKMGTHFLTISEAERASILASLGSTWAFEGVAFAVNTVNPDNSAPLYRFYSSRSGHFYTASVAERDAVLTKLSKTYRPEGVAFNVCGASVLAKVVFRFYNKKNGGHFYTASVDERDAVMANLSKTYAFEGTGFDLAP